MLTELKKSEFTYKTVHEGDNIFIESEKKFELSSVIYDEINENWILAVESKTPDYIYLTKDFEVIKALSEDMGVMPNLIKSEDGRIWTSIVLTAMGKAGETVLPLVGREEVSNLVCKRDYGMEYFTLGNCTYGCFEDIFDSAKVNQIAKYEFDKKGQYKNRKMVKLEGITDGYPVVSGNCVYFATKSHELYKTDHSFVPEKVCKMSDSLPFGFLIGVSEDGFSMMFYRDEKTNTKADFDYSGKMLKEEIILKNDGMIINHSIIAATSEYTAVVIRTETGNYLYRHMNGTFSIQKMEETDKSVVAINNQYYAASPLNGSKRLRIGKY